MNGEVGKISLVIPVYNEAESLRPLYAEIVQTAEKNQYDFEIWLIDDGSTDPSWSVISELAQADGRVQGIRFRRNFGKAAALHAGFERARGTYVFTLDADLQDDPAEIPNFLHKLNEGFDVVSGWKKIRHDPWHKVFPSRVFNGMVSSLTGVKLHDHNCGMKGYRVEAAKAVRLYGEMHRFIPVLAASLGFRIGELVIHHRARKFGRSKYGFRRFLRGFLDLLTVKFLTTYQWRPNHLFGFWALFFLVIAIPLGILEYLVRIPMGVYVLLAMALQLGLIGLVAELFAFQRPTKPFEIREQTSSRNL
jgi:dolichol-phosphate mannosyltransferase